MLPLTGIHGYYDRNQDTLCPHSKRELSMKNYILWLLLILGTVPYAKAQFGDIKLIAHRGGVVDEHTDEHSLAAIEKAAQQGYYMVELDVRSTKDGILVVHHDKDLKRFFNVDKLLADLTWEEMRRYTSTNGHQIQELQTMLALCRSRGLQVMIDLKISGSDQSLFECIYDMLHLHGMADQALIIPSAEATDYFRGKIKLSCTRQQLETYQTRDDYSPAHYYLFANPSPEDFEWAVAHHIQVVGAINYRASSGVDYAALAKKLIELGVGYVQLDSRFAKYFVAPVRGEG